MALRYRGDSSGNFRYDLSAGKFIDSGFNRFASLENNKPDDERSLDVAEPGDEP
jgi:hypothetical protein